MSWLLLAALAQTPPAEEPAGTGVSPVRIVSFNVWGLPWPITPRRRRRLAAIDAWIGDERFDVVALQEAWRGARSLLETELHYPLARGDSGLALASRHPIERLRFVPFEAARGPDRLKAKGVWWVRVELPQGPCNLGVLHLQAGGGRASSEVRRTQVETVLASVPEGPVVLLGDFNLHRDDPGDRATHARLVEAGLIEAVPVRDHGTSRYGSHRLDRVYVSVPSGWTVSRVRTRREVEHSDHYPVVLELGRRD